MKFPLLGNQGGVENFLLVGGFWCPDRHQCCAIENPFDASEPRGCDVARETVLKDFFFNIFLFGIEGKIVQDEVVECGWISMFIFRKDWKG